MRMMIDILLFMSLRIRGGIDKILTHLKKKDRLPLPPDAMPEPSANKLIRLTSDNHPIGASRYELNCRFEAAYLFDVMPWNSRLFPVVTA